MLYETAQAWHDAPQKRILLFGMSGLGKTHLSDMLRRTGEWFHYSVDYRIGTRYLGERIADNAKAHAMQVPFLAELLRTDSIYIASNITFSNLAPLSAWLGKPGDPAKGGLDWEEYRRRQNAHREAEIAALLDTVPFIDRAEELYGYPHFVCDSGGSICEVVDPSDPADPVMTALSAHMLPVWIKGSDGHTEELIARFDAAPKPIYYRPDELEASWRAYLAETGAREATVDPDAFIRWAYARVIKDRQPRYEAMANWGVTVSADDVVRVRGPEDLEGLIGGAFGDRGT